MSGRYRDYVANVYHDHIVLSFKDVTNPQRRVLLLDIRQAVGEIVSEFPDGHDKIGLAIAEAKKRSPDAEAALPEIPKIPAPPAPPAPPATEAESKKTADAGGTPAPAEKTLSDSAPAENAAEKPPVASGSAPGNSAAATS